jgi:hypothetical protein
MVNLSEIPENEMLFNNNLENANPEMKSTPLGIIISVNAVDRNANRRISRRRAP